MDSRRGWILMGALAALLVVGALPAAAQGDPVGLRISNVTIDPATATVDFDVTLTTTSPWDSVSYTGFLGNLIVYQSTWVNTYPTSSNNNYGSDFWITSYFQGGDPLFPAIDYGDGSTVPWTTIAPVVAGTPGQYRGSFSHTYPGPGTYDLRVTSGFFPTATPAYGTVLSISATSASPLVRYAFWSGIGYGHTAGSGYSVITSGTDSEMSTWTGTSPSFALAAYAGGAAPGTIFLPASIGVPTVSEIGLLVLTLAMAGAGLFLLRR